MPIATSPVLLAAFVLNGLILGAILARAARSAPALRWLAILVVVLALRLVPYAIGFTGVYDRWRWLTFLPVDATLALGPLLWCYLIVLARGEAPRRLMLHFTPAFVQVAYQALAFLIPQPAKGQYYQHVHLPFIEPIGLVMVLVSLVAYTIAAWRMFRTWQCWMDDNLGNRDEFRCDLVRAVLVALTVVVVLGFAFAVRHATIAPLNYAGRAPLIVLYGILVYALGIIGAVQGGRTFPVIADGEPVRVEPQRRGRPPNDYEQLSGEWTSRVRENGWHRDPSLTLAKLSLQLNTSPRTASRVIREGSGLTFHGFINRLRVEDVVQRLQDPTERRNTLQLALDAGFSSKASYLRAFREYTGRTASAIRQQRDNPATSVPVSEGSQKAINPFGQKLATSEAHGRVS
jgi:AraC-like DNA-binding protein